MDQEVEMTGTSAAWGDSTRKMATTTSVFSRVIPIKMASGGTIVRGLADSVIVTPHYSGGRGETRRFDSRWIQMRIRSDGWVEMMQEEQSSENPELKEFFGQMPATLPAKAVSVGQHWNREMQVPLRGDVHVNGIVRATFVFDSLSRNGDVAYVSMHGTLSHDRKPGEKHFDASGTITGALQLNRRLGWITDSRATIALTSTITPVSDSLRKSAKVNGIQPIHVRTKITQWSRVTLPR